MIFSNISFIGPKKFLEYWGAPIENILSKTINMDPFCGNEEKKPTFHVDLIEFDHKTTPDFRFFPIFLSWVQKCFWSTGGTIWNFSELNYQSVSFLWKRRKRNLFFMLIWLNLTINWSLIFDFSNMSFIGPKMLLEYWGHQLKVFWAKLPICIVFAETKKKKHIFHDYLIVLTIKWSLIFDFFRYLFYRSKNVSGALRAPIENILSKTTNMHRFCGNEEKETYFSRLFDCIDHKMVLDFWFFSDISFIGPKTFLEYWGAPIENILSKTINMDPSLWKRRKENYISCWFDWIWP